MAVDLGEVFDVEVRVFSSTEMKCRWAEGGRVGLPCSPGGEEVQTKTKADPKDGERPCSCQRERQAVAGQKHVPGLAEFAVGGVTSLKAGA